MWGAVPSTQKFNKFSHSLAPKRTQSFVFLEY
jgi:hypothetical protein